MRKTLAYLAAAGYLTMSATAAHATDGTIMFSGKLVAATCAITIQGPTANGITIQLPTIRASDLATPGVTAGGTPFAIALTECPPNQEVRVDFLNNTGYVDTSTGYVVNSGSATNVELQLLGTGSPINLMTYVGDYQSTDGSGTVAFLFSVRYIAVAAAATAGSVAATLTFDINYK